MIRFIYWLLATIEVILILFVLILFIVTDSRTVTLFAKESADTYNFQYESIRGNLFDGLKVRGLSYGDKKLFNEATIHWNPLTLFYNKITLTEVNIEGVELQNIMATVKELSFKSNSSAGALEYDIALNKIHLDINPYLFEGVKFSSFLLDSSRVKVKKDLDFSAETLHLSFDSDIVNVDIDGKIEESRLLLENANLKNISSEAITILVERLLKKSHSKKEIKTSKERAVKTAPFTLFKEIKAKHILGTLKPIKYGNLELKNVRLTLKNGVVDPYHSYDYKAEDLKLTAKTNFGSIDYKGEVKHSTIYARGKLLLTKKLFSKYSLPLNFKGLKKLNTTLKLNHHGVWVEIDKGVKQLLSSSNIFNLDIKKSHHKLSYIYGEDLVIESSIEGNTTFSKKLDIEAKTVIDFTKRDAHYTGKVEVSEFTSLLPKFSDYLFKGMRFNFDGLNSKLSVDVVSDLLKGEFKTDGYKDATLKLESKEDNIALNKIVENLDPILKNEKFAFKSDTYLDFYNIEKSKTTLKIDSSFLNIVSKGRFALPAKIVSTLSVPQNSSLRKIDKNIRFDTLKNLQINLEIDKDRYTINIDDKITDSKLSMLFNSSTKNIKGGKIDLGDEEFIVDYDSSGDYKIYSNVKNIESLLKRVNHYYKVELPPLKGGVELMLRGNAIEQSVRVSSQQLEYLDKSKQNSTPIKLYDIDLRFNIKNKRDIELEKYQFSLENSEYISKIYSNKPSYFIYDSSRFIVNKLWFNDKVLIQGSYNIDKNSGEFTLNTQHYRFNNSDIDLKFNSDLKVKIKDEKFDVEGDITLLDGKIEYEVEGSQIVEDSDIIIVQDISKEKSVLFKNVKLYLKIHNKNPILYSGKDANINFYNELTIVKNYNQKMQVTGMSTIVNGYYELEDKHFLLDESHLYFAGDVKKPLLDIKANYTKEQYLVHIFISGTTDEPIINFNSEPYLTQQEILSLILFDGTGTSDGHGAEAYTLLGGTFAKGFMKSLGIDIDHFLLGADENDQLSLEIGKKVSKNISVLYLNKDGLSGAKVRVEHSDMFETDIIIQPPNTSSIEFLYKRDH